MSRDINELIAALDQAQRKAVEDRTEQLMVDNIAPLEFVELKEDDALRIRQSLGVSLRARVNVISDTTKQIAAVELDFGINVLPTRELAKQMVEEAIKGFNEAMGTTDGRVTTLKDFGLLDSRFVEWKDFVDGEETPGTGPATAV